MFNLRQGVNKTYVIAQITLLPVSLCSGIQRSQKQKTLANSHAKSTQAMYRWQRVFAKSATPKKRVKCATNRFTT